MYLRNGCFVVPRFLNPQTAYHIVKISRNKYEIDHLEEILLQGVYSKANYAAIACNIRNLK